MPLTVKLLREAFRSLRQWQALYEAQGIDLIYDPATHEAYALQDMEYLLEQAQKLPTRQRQAIMLFLVENHREVDVAIAMGLSPTNPIGLYATEGLKKIVQWYEDGKLPRYRPEPLLDEETEATKGS